MGTLYEFIAIYHPPKDKEGNTPLGSLIIGPTSVMAKGENEVTMKAARAIPDEYLDKLDHVEIKVRPF